MKNKKQLLIIYSVAAVVALFQLPLIYNTLNAHEIYTNIKKNANGIFNAHQKIENTKIKIAGELDDFIVWDTTNKNDGLMTTNDNNYNTHATNTAQNTNNTNNNHNNNALDSENKGGYKLTETESSTTKHKTYQQEGQEQHNITNDNKTPETNSEYGPTELAVAGEGKDDKIIVDNNFNNVTEPNDGQQKTEASKLTKEGSKEGGAQKKYCLNNCKLLLIGDSIAGEFYYALSRYLAKNNPAWKSIDAHKVSSGLTKTSYYDWPATLAQLLQTHRPDYVLVMVGTNDAQNMVTSDDNILKFNTEKWREHYKMRVENIIKMINNTNSRYFFIGIPVVKSPKFNKKLQIIRNIQQEAASENYIQSESIFGKDEDPSTIIKNIRKEDGVHLNNKGAELLVNLVFEVLLKRIQK